MIAASAVRPEPLQAFVVPVQAPDVTRMLARPAQCRVEAEVGRVHLGRLLDMPPFEQERAVGMSRRLHPAPRFVIRQGVVEFDRPPQMGEGIVVSAFPVVDFAVEHGGCDGQDVAGGVVEHVSGIGDPGVGLL